MTEPYERRDPGPDAYPGAPVPQSPYPYGSPQLQQPSSPYGSPQPQPPFPHGSPESQQPSYPYGPPGPGMPVPGQPTGYPGGYPAQPAGPGYPGGYPAQPPAPGYPAGYPAPAPAQVQQPNAAEMLAALAAAGVQLPGATAAGARSASEKSERGERRRSMPSLRVWGLIILVIGLGGLYARAYLWQHQHPSKLTIWQVMWVTLPFVAAAGYVVYRFALGRGLRIMHLLGLVVGLAGTSYLTGISSGHVVSNSLFQFDPKCLLQNTCAQTLAKNNPLSYVGKVAANYWHLYGGPGLISALVVGAVIGLGLGLTLRRSAR